MILLAIAAQLAAPEPINADRWFRPEDVPIEALKPDVLMTVLYGLTVTPDGQIRDCRIERSSGNDELDRYTCSLALRRARVKPARDINGQATYGVFRYGTNWWIGGAPPRNYNPGGNLEVEVLQLPAKVKSPELVDVSLAVEADGRVHSCVEFNDRDHADLIEVACEQLLRTFKATPVTDAAGKAVPSVQSARVVFIKKD